MSNALVKGLSLAAKSFLLGEGVNTAYQFGTGEQLSPAARFAAYLGAGAAAKGALGQSARNAARAYMAPAGLSYGLQSLQRHNFGGSMLDPNFAKESIADGVLNKAKDWYDQTGLGRIQNAFQFSSLHTPSAAQRVHQQMLDRAKAYLAGR